MIIKCLPQWTICHTVASLFKHDNCQTKQHRSIKLAWSECTLIARFFFFSLAANQLESNDFTTHRKEELNDKVEKALCVLAEDILDDVVEFACKMAKHRGSQVLHRNDVRLAFEKRLKV